MFRGPRTVNSPSLALSGFACTEMTSNLLCSACWLEDRREGLTGLASSWCFSLRVKRRWTYSHKIQSFVDPCHSEFLWKLFDLAEVILLFSKVFFLEVVPLCFLSIGGIFLSEQMSPSAFSILYPFLITTPLPSFLVPPTFHHLPLFGCFSVLWQTHGIR